MVSTKYAHPRYYKRRERNGFWTLMPLQGRFNSDSIMVNDFTYDVLERLEAGKSLSTILEELQAKFPDEDEQKLRSDLFHAASRLRKYDFTDVGGFADNCSILDNGRKFAPNALQPCPLGELPVLSQFFQGIMQGTDDEGPPAAGKWLYNVFVQGPSLESGPDIPHRLYDVNRMVEAHVTGGEVFWAYVDKQREIIGALSTSNYLMMSPVVAVTAMVVTGDNEEQRLKRATEMLSRLAEALAVFGLSEKIRITSSPFVSSAEKNMTVFDEILFSAMGHSRFRKAAFFPSEINGQYHLEYYDCLLPSGGSESLH